MSCVQKGSTYSNTWNYANTRPIVGYTGGVHTDEEWSYAGYSVDNDLYYDNGVGKSLGGVTSVVATAAPDDMSFKWDHDVGQAGEESEIKELSSFALRMESGDEQNYDETDYTTTSSTYQDSGSLTFTPSTAGDYIIVALAQVKHSAVSGQCPIRLNVDGTSYQNVRSYARGAGWWKQFTMAQVVNLDATSHTIKIQFAETASGTTTVARTRIIALRADNFDNVYYDQTESTYSTTSTSWQDTNVDHTFTPESGDHLIIQTGSVGATSGENVGWRADFNGTQYGESDYILPPTSEPGIPTAAFKIDTLDETSHTYRQQIKRTGGAGTHYHWSGASIVMQLEGTPAAAGGASTTRLTISNIAIGF